jgi:hypothetical protein
MSLIINHMRSRIELQGPHTGEYMLEVLGDYRDKIYRDRECLRSRVFTWCVDRLGYAPTLTDRNENVAKMHFKSPEDIMVFRLKWGLGPSAAMADYTA